MLHSELGSIIALVLMAGLAVCIQYIYVRNVQCKVCRSIYLFVCCFFALGSMLVLDLEIPLINSHVVVELGIDVQVLAMVAWMFRVLPFALLMFFFRAYPKKRPA